MHCLISISHSYIHDDGSDWLAETVVKHDLTKKFSLFLLRTIKAYFQSCSNFVITIRQQLHPNPLHFPQTGSQTLWHIHTGVFADFQFLAAGFALSCCFVWQTVLNWPYYRVTPKNQNRAMRVCEIRYIKWGQFTLRITITHIHTHSHT